MVKVNSRSLKCVLGFLVLSCCVSSISGQSQYAKIQDGVGNILVGEVLPYNDDAGYKNVVLDSVKLSEMSKWENFYFRAYLASKINDIEHDIRVLVWNFEGVGKRARQFNEEIGGNYILKAERKDDSAEYGERTEWSKQYPDFNTSPKRGLGTFIKALDRTNNVTIVEYLNDYDFRDPYSFEYRELNEDIGESVVFSPATLKEWKDNYGLSSVKVTLQAFSFVDGGETSYGETEKVLSMDEDGDLVEKEKLTAIVRYTAWERMEYLAAGQFTIVLD